MILSASWVIPISSPYIADGAVVVDEDEIRDLGPTVEMLKRYPNQAVRDLPGAALLPGLVNVHSHLELTVLRGYLENLSFWEWIRCLTQTKYKLLTREEIRISALVGACEAIRAGITTLGDAMDLGASLDALTSSGLRGILYQEVFSPRAIEADKRLLDLERKLARLEHQKRRAGNRQKQAGWSRTNRIVLGVSPHAPYSVSGRLFQKVHHWAVTRKIPVCIHVAESEEESQLINEGKGPMVDALRSRGIEWVAPRCSPIQYLHRLGVMAPRTLLVHCVHLKTADLRFLKTSQACVAHCPKSNWKLGHGSMNLKNIVEAGIPVGLGSDSVASNNSMDLFEEMRFSLSNPSWYSRYRGSQPATRWPSGFIAEQALHMATLGGARALGLSGSIGSLEVGKKADLIAVDLARVHTMPVFSPVTAIVHSARASDVIMTMVDGETLLEEGRVTTLDEAGLKRNVGPILRKLMEVSRLEHPSKSGHDQRTDEGVTGKRDG